jgi:hypothetical protein
VLSTMLPLLPALACKVTVVPVMVEPVAMEMPLPVTW